MVSEKIIIKNSQGLHMRPAGILTKEMTKFDSEVTIKYNGSDINAKSIMNVMAAGIKSGSDIEVVCNGTDEENALQKMIELAKNNFGE